jgi:hypothetical protein
MEFSTLFLSLNFGFKEFTETIKLQVLEPLKLFQSECNKYVLDMICTYESGKTSLDLSHFRYEAEYDHYKKV